MCADARTAREVPRETLTSHVCSRRRPGNAASRSARPHSQPCCSRSLISAGIQLPVCYLISGTRFAEEPRDAIARWRETKRRFCTLQLPMSEGKEPTAEREIERPTLHPSFPSRVATFLRGQTNRSVLLGKGRGRSGPEVTIRVGKRVPFVS